MWCGVFSTIPPREIFRNLWLSDCQVLCLPFEPCLSWHGSNALDSSSPPARSSPTESRCHQDKHKAPTLPLIRPLSLQDPMRSSTFIKVPVQPVKYFSSN